MTRVDRPVLVVGGAGFIGSNLAHHLLGTGQRVRIYDDLSRAGVDDNLRALQAEHGNRLEVCVADVRDREQLRAAVGDAAAVFHLAAQVAVTTSLLDPRNDLEVNLGGTFEVLEALRALRNPPPLVFTSTNKVYGSLHDVRLEASETRWSPADPAVARTGIDEARPLSFRSPYGCSKGAADQYVLDYAESFGLAAVVFRMSCIYGPRQRGNEDQGWIAHFLIRAITGREVTIYGDGRQVRDVLYVDDLVDALVRAWRGADDLRGRAFNIGGGPGQTLSLLELLDLIERLEGRRPQVRFEGWREGDQRYYVSNTTAFHGATGWRSRVGVGPGVETLHGWLREQRAGGVS
jgi:CDP-paratose 2-epimerase